MVKKKTVLTHHNDERIDWYYTLREAKRKETQAFLKEQNQRCENFFQSQKHNLRKEIYNELKTHILPIDESLPYQLGDYAYFERIKKDEDYPIYLRKKNGSEHEEVILDLTQLAQGKDFFEIGDYEPSYSGRFIAYSTDEIGDEDYTLRVLDTHTKLLLDESIPHTSPGLTWTLDEAGFYYVRLDAHSRPLTVMYHLLGNPAEKDQVIYEEKDPQFFLTTSSSSDLKYIFISAEASHATEFQFISAEKLAGKKLHLFRARQPQIEYYLDHGTQGFFCLTNMDQRENFAIDLYTPDNKILSLVGSSKTKLIEDFELFRRYMVIWSQEKAQTILEVLNLETLQLQTLQLPPICYEAWSHSNFNYDSEEILWHLAPLHAPKKSLTLNLSSLATEVVRERKLPISFQDDDYCSQRLWCPTYDNQEIPISVIYKKSLFKPGINPGVIYGYGAYGASLTQEFRSSRLPLLDRGFIYVLAHVRGGQEMGRSWYEQGKLKHKLNTFRDFVAVTQFLIQEKMIDPANIHALGGSAGGLLMGYLANNHPKLYRSLSAYVPFVDVLTTMLDSSLPLTALEYEEWGNPQNSEDYHLIKSYSPYDNIKEQEYPHIYATSGLHDTRVAYWEPAKWIARLQESNTNPKSHIILRTDMKSGHGGKSSRDEALAEIAEELAFILHCASS